MSSCISKLRLCIYYIGTPVSGMILSSVASSSSMGVGLSRRVASEQSPPQFGIAGSFPIGGDEDFARWPMPTFTHAQIVQSKFTFPKTLEDLDFNTGAKAVAGAVSDAVWPVSRFLQSNRIELAHHWLIVKSSDGTHIWAVNFSASHPMFPKTTVGGLPVYGAQDEICWGPNPPEVLLLSLVEGKQIAENETFEPVTRWTELWKEMSLFELRHHMRGNDAPYDMLSRDGKNCQSYSDDLFFSLTGAKREDVPPVSERSWYRSFFEE